MTLLSRKSGKVCIITDAPRFYGRLEEAVRIIPISSATLQDWKGPQDNFLRTKILAIRHLVAEYPERDVVYVDADTFCFGDPQQLANDLTAGKSLLHALEGPLFEMPTKSERRMGQQTLCKTFGGTTVQKSHVMYNSGVVGLGGGSAFAILRDALAICDDMIAAGVTPRLIEQYSFSIALTEAGPVATANSVIGHYWGNKRDWNALISEFFITHHLTATTLEAQIDAAGRTDFRTIPVYRKTRSKEAKLQAWLERRRDATARTFIPAAGEAAAQRSERWVARR
ncbi:hypothetical protein [Lewinella sp. IMCC34191]|uniref:hypothetical protein n=1 Tax=Lewinella sp. IMCC34191 TaxID=2259172 RepID=UPI000E233018|nr:hypothetical protein [Lewinella sp. IMCC34191]